MAAKLVPFQPNYVTRPGEVLESHLEARGMTKAEFANRCGRPLKTISEIVHGKAAITPETAIQFERVLGVPATLWLALESRYRLDLAKRAERASLARFLPWTEQFPVKDLLRHGAFEDPASETDLVGKLLAFFGVGTVDGWEETFGTLRVAYRRSAAFAASPGSMTAWLRLGELAADALTCAPYEKRAFKEALAGCRTLTERPFVDAHPELVERLAAAGVALVLVPELPKTHVSGVSRWLAKDRALIQMSLRHKTGDHAWFTLFHEAAHVLLHSKKGVYIDEPNGERTDEEEEADRFARDLLIPPGTFSSFVHAGEFSETAVRRFAANVGVAPGIVVGRLQHEGHVPFAALNRLKERLTWA